MAETSATRTLRGHLAAGGAHCQRFEDKMSPGIPDMGVGKHGVYMFLEGKFIKQIPARSSTLIRFGGKDEPRLAHQKNWLTAHRKAGGLAFWWIRVRDKGWYLMPGHYHWLTEGVTQDELFQQHDWGSAKAMAEAIDSEMRDHAAKV